jgi:hypothetical protein
MSGSAPSPGGCIDGVVCVQIDLHVFNALPESLDEHVVSPTPFSVHADLDAVLGEQPSELVAGELVPLVSIEDSRKAVPDNRLLHRVQTEISRERVGESPAQHPATGPVKHGEQIDEAPCQSSAEVDPFVLM